MEDFKENIKRFLPFLEDLRSRLYRGVVLFIIFLVIGFVSAGIILKKILKLVHIDQVTIATSSAFQFTEVALDIGFFLGIIVSVPYMIYSLYDFTMPALTRVEKIKLLKSVPLSIGLFILGFVYGFFILYSAWGLLADINIRLGIANYWNIGKFLSQMLITSVLLGLIFELPLLLSLSIKLGILTPHVLKKHRRIAYFLTLCLTALLPPTDGVSLLVMALPLVVLYEGTILLNKNNKKILDLDQKLES